MTIEERFWSKVQRGAAGECWPWLANRSPQGYGMFYRSGRGHGAHRVAYELAVGPIPDGLELDHLCRNPACVNPAHLEPVTRAENTRRGLSGELKKTVVTHCPHGHAYDEENTRIGPTGWRVCRACQRAIHARKRAARGAGPPNATKTHCVHGHEFTPENTHVYRGRRVCRACKRATAARIRDNERSAA